MAFRWGTQGDELWPICRRLGIAALGYYDNEWKPIVEDCSKMSKTRYDRAWQDKWPGNTAGRSSLWNFAREMNVGDVIYVKQGPSIVGKGSVASEYLYNPSVMRDPNYPHGHYRKVDWEAKFQPIKILLGAELMTLLRLDYERIQAITQAEQARGPGK